MAYIWLGMVLLLASSLSIEARRKNKKLRTCEKLAIPECANLGYQRTRFPNPLTNITTQEETRNLTRYLSILDQLNCTKTNAMPFLCSVYVPMCSEKRPVSLPCREFCEKAVGYCPALAASYGVQWPAALLCSRYPSEKDDGKCLNKLRYRTKGIKGKKDNKKQKIDELRCCRLGIVAGKRGNSCNLTEALSAKQGKRMKVLKACKRFKSKFNECCQKATSRQNKKQQRKNKKDQKKANKKKRKQQKVEKKQRKQEKQQKRKQKQDERKQKKQERKQKKENRKQKLNTKSG